MTDEMSGVLLTHDERVTDAVLATAAALGTLVETVDTAEEAVRRWGTAEVVLIGADQAAALASAAPPRRKRVYLVGFEADALSTWSLPIGAEVIPLPHGLAWLSAVLSQDPDRGSPLIGVVGGSGGIGASTLAAGLAFAARRRGWPAALVDVDPLGGGVDLLLGAERTPGWRWPRLLGARGEVSDVRRFLPCVDGVTVVSMARPGTSGESGEVDQPQAESLQAVLGSLSRHHKLVVLDAGRAPLPCVRQQLQGASEVVLLSGDDVRSVAAAGQMLRALELAEPRLIVRATGGRVAPELVGRALGADVLGTLATDARVARAAEVGDPPGRSRRGRWSKQVDVVLERLMAGVSDGD
ncbi:septum site-determining protein Ssd [Nigerium massiliense]|uniref:septum site-determining protein Ssd n=1 Tax=Nigerium massiliense TaxID=1522317 RepID=UPI00058D44F2|nr:septum site-determining protein Ssd [Nigerium massiliense]